VLCLSSHLWPRAYPLTEQLRNGYTVRRPEQFTNRIQTGHAAPRAEIFAEVKRIAAGALYLVWDDEFI